MPKRQLAEVEQDPLGNSCKFVKTGSSSPVKERQVSYFNVHVVLQCLFYNNILGLVMAGK